MTMQPKIEYRVCTSQGSRVTFVNGEWQGARSPDTEEALQTCPEVWAFLTAAGNEGWELVNVVSRFRPSGDATSILDRFLLGTNEEGWETWDTLYLKRLAT